jgi:hypothetical protein
MIAATFGEIVDLIRAIIWPVALIAVLIAYRKHLPRLLETMSRRMTGVSWRSFSVSFAVASEVSPQVWESLKYLADPMAPDSVPDSGSALFQLMGAGMRADSARFDLREGHDWLTSRLYIFAVVLSELLGVRCLVFTETRDGIARRFVGLADPQAVRTALEHRYDWLKAALGKAVARHGPVEAPVLSLHELFSEQWQAQNIASAYLQSDLIKRVRPATAAAEPNWVQLRPPDDGQVREEHAEWISGGAHLEAILGEALAFARVVEGPDMPPREVMRQAVLKSGAFVAVIDTDGRFARLLNRTAILEQLGRELAERSTAA